MFKYIIKRPKFANLIRKSHNWSNITFASTETAKQKNYNNDTYKHKVNLMIDMYRTFETESTVQFDSIKYALEDIDIKMHKSLPTIGNANFIESANKLLYGDNEYNISTVQTLSGTGASRVGGEFLKNVMGKKNIYIPNISWLNHDNIFKNAGLNILRYNYYSHQKNKFDCNEMLKSLNNIDNNSVILMDVCGHNPTGCDPTQEEWDEILNIIKTKNHIAFFDCSHQGLASGDYNKDVYCIRKGKEININMMVSQSLSHNFGLYGERLGTLSINTKSNEEKLNVTSQLEKIIKTQYKNPPSLGAIVVDHIIRTPDLFKLWQIDVSQISNSLLERRFLLSDLLQLINKTRNWEHIVKQQGIYTCTGLNYDEVITLQEQYHIYMTSCGCINVAGLSKNNIKYVADSIATVVNKEKVKLVLTN